MTRTDEAKRMLDETKLELERKNHLRVVELCDKLLADYSDVINVPGVQDTRAAELCKLGRFTEAEPVFREFMQTHKKLGMPIASTTWMYHWLICYYKGDEKKSMDQFTLLDEARAVALLNQGDAAEPVLGTGSEKSVGNTLGPADLTRHLEELGKASDKCWDSYAAIEAAGAIAIPYLLPLINSDNYLLRGRSIDLLGRVGDSRAVEPLKRAAVISEKEFRSMIFAPDRATTIKVQGLDIPVHDILTEYRSLAVNALEVVNARIVVQVQEENSEQAKVTPQQPKTMKRWWQFWK